MYGQLNEMSEKYNIPIWVKPGYANAYYDGNSIIVGDKVGNPTIIAHEIGHHLNKDKYYKLPDPMLITGLGALAKIITPEQYKPVTHAVASSLAAFSALTALRSELEASTKAKEVYQEADQSILDDLRRTAYTKFLTKGITIPNVVLLGASYL